MVEKISVQIGLEGADEVKKQLADIGAAGTKAFADAGDASQGAAAEIEKVGEATEKAAESTSKFSLETVKTSAQIAELTTKIALHGVEIVQAVRHHNTLLQSLVKLATGFNSAARVVGALTPELALVGVTVGSTAAAVAAGVVAFEAAEKVLTKFASSTEKINNTLQTLAATTGKSFDELQRGEATFQQIGISAETFRSSIGKIGDTLAAVDTKNLTSGMKDIVALVQQIAAGDKGITFAGWVTAEDKVKGVSIAMKQAADAGKDATQVLLEFIRNADLASAIKVGAAFGLSEADVDRVRRLGENISDLTQRIKGAGPLISPAAAASFEQMRTSIANVDSAWARLKQSMESTVFTSIAASFSATMNSMEAAAVNGVARIVEAFNQAGRAMATPPPEFTAALTAVGTQLQNAVTGLNSVVANIVGAVMQQAGASAAQIQAVKDQINGVATAAQTAGQTVQQAGVLWTSYGTLAQQGTNTAKAGLTEVTTMFTSFGTVASQEGAKAGAAMQQAAGGITQVGTAAQSASDKVAAFVSQLASIAWDAISGAGVAAWNALTGAIQGAIDKLLKYIGLKPSAPEAFAGAPGKARGGLLGGRGTGTSDSNLAWLSRGEYIMPASAVRQPGVLSFLEAMRRSGGIPGFAEGGSVGGTQENISVTFSQIMEQLSNAINPIIDEILRIADANVQSMDQVAQSLDGIIDTLKRNASRVADGLTSVAQSLSSVLKNMQSTLEEKATGGLLGGRGTGTSDSNLAWVSRGEHIMPARAVAQPGVLAFLEALRRSGGDLSRVLDGMGRFALGGMVPRAIPAFATGGLAGGGNHITIQFPGMPAIGGLRASSSVVEQLQKAAALAQVRSGGRKPSRYS